MTKRAESEQKKAESEKGITRISVRGFKSLAEECSIQIRPLTILAGANSSGKSSIMQPLLLLKQTLECPYDPGPLLLDGPNVRFTSPDQFLSGTVLTNFVRDRFQVTVNTLPSAYVAETFRKKTDTEIELIESIYDLDDKQCRLRPGMRHEEVATQIGRLGGAYETLARVGPWEIQWEVSCDRCFLYATDYIITNGQKSATIFGPVTTASRFAAQIKNLIHVPALRGNPVRSYRKAAVGPDFPGTFENYVASVINHWQRTKDARLEELGGNLKNLGLTWKVEATELDATRVELRVGRCLQSEADDMVNIADVGFGVSQVLPVLVALLVAEPGQMVYLEQPELHLHPKARVALAGILADAAKRGVRVVAETHSALLLLAVQTLVAKGSISPENVILHWFKRGDDGVTKVTSAELDEAGAFGEDWPEDFGDVELEAESEYLKAAESRLMKR
jgi:predicted ATPase